MFNQTILSFKSHVTVFLLVHRMHLLQTWDWAIYW